MYSTVGGGKRQTLEGEGQTTGRRKATDIGRRGTDNWKEENDSQGDEARDRQ